MAADWKSAYAEMHRNGETGFPPAGLYYVLQLTRQASQNQEGRSLTPAELLEVFHKQLRRDFGSLASKVLEDWRFHTPEDLGRAVMLLGRHGCLTLEPTDTVEAFAVLGTEL